MINRHKELNFGSFASQTTTTTTYAAIVLQMEHKVPFHGPIVCAVKKRDVSAIVEVLMSICVSGSTI